MSGNRRERAFSAESLLRILRSYPKAGSYIVGFSGGADSTALLHALNIIRHQLDVEISAVHVNHGLHKDADQWQAHCESFCRAYNIRLSCLHIDLKHDTGKGMEAEARTLRYRAMTGLVDKNTALLTAHHADDQSETLVLNLMRGSGVDGLSAMPESRPIGKGLLQRPLLGFSNEHLLQYLRQNRIEWIDDPSNQMLDQDRNFLRNQVIPQLEQRWPGINRRLLLTRQAMADARILLEKLADNKLEALLLHPRVLNLSHELCDDPQLLRLVIRRWARKAGAGPVPAYKLEDFSAQLAEADNQTRSELSWDGWRIRLYQQRLWLLNGAEVRPCPYAKLPAGNFEVNLGKDIGRLVFSGRHSKHHENAPFQVRQSDDGIRPWTGEQIVISGRQDTLATSIKHGGIHKKIKKLFQAAGIPPWLRNSVPLCQSKGVIVAVGDWYFEPSFEMDLKQNDTVMQWQPEHPLLKFIACEQHAVQARHRRQGGNGSTEDQPASTTTVDPEGAVR